MYKIIGGDQKEYGPVDADQIRLWIADGRLAAQSKAQAEGSADWKPLSEFPEFADALGAAPQAVPTPAPEPFQARIGVAASLGGRESALLALNGPATALKVTAILGIVWMVLNLVFNALTLVGVDFGFRQGGPPGWPSVAAPAGGGVGVLVNLIGIVVGVVILNGVAKMRALQNYPFAFATGILAMLPCVSPCCLLGLPFGIWALVVLGKPEIKSQFS